jgi:hypothetical protein
LLGHQFNRGTEEVVKESPFLGVELIEKGDHIAFYDEKKYMVDQICQMMGIPTPTLYKYIQTARELKSKP